jgi:long-chain acyl-CoA synthetase
VCFRGPNCFVGYFKLPEKTAEAFDADGWLHSGDIGFWDADGNLRIVDRKKQIFKLSQGEYVAPEKIETAYGRSPLVAQVFVHGDSLQACVVGIVVPNEESLKAWAKANGKGEATFAALCADPAVVKAVWASMKAAGDEAGLKGFEKIAALHLDSRLWTPESQLLTPTFKARRQQLRAFYAADIDRMYASGIGVVAGMTGVKQGETMGATGTGGGRGGGGGAAAATLASPPPSAKADEDKPLAVAAADVAVTSPTGSA